MNLSNLPALGQPLEGGIFVGITTTSDGTHAAVTLLADKPSAPMTWPDAMEWAKGLGATLPTRPVAAMLFANAKDHFEPRWYWTSEALDGSGAWYQLFSYGSQYSNDTSYEGRARAVRLIQLTA